MKKQIVLAISVMIVVLSFYACEGVFEYSPYEAVVSPSYKNTTKKNLDRLKSISINDTTFKFALISDTHHSYDNLRKVVSLINENKEILFVIHCGDLTDYGIRLEYEVFHDIMDNLYVPYLTAIGNHDSKSNGADIYTSMFGVHNYSFTFNNSKFMLFDDVMWEVYKTLDTNWLKQEFSDKASYNNRFIISHIPPFAVEFDSLDSDLYKNIMLDNDMPLSIHGHNHSYYNDDYYSDGTQYLIVPTIMNKSYIVITVNKSSYLINKVDF